MICLLPPAHFRNGFNTIQKKSEYIVQLIMRVVNKESILQKSVLTSKDILILFGNKDKIIEYTPFDESDFRYISFLVKGGFYVDKNVSKSINVKIPQYVIDIKNERNILKELIKKDFERIDRQISFFEDKLMKTISKSTNEDTPVKKGIKSNLYRLRIYLDRLNRDVEYLNESLENLEQELNESIRKLEKIKSLDIDAIQYDWVEIKFEYDENLSSHEYYKENDEYDDESDDFYIDEDFIDDNKDEHKLEDIDDKDVHAHTTPFIYLNKKGEMAFHPSYPYYKVYYTLKMNGYMETVNKKETIIKINKIPYYILPVFIKIIGDSIERAEYYGDL